MRRKIRQKAAIRRNKSVDPRQLEELAEVLRQLRSKGVKGKRYGILAPFTRRPMQVASEDSDDPRMVHLR